MKTNSLNWNCRLFFELEPGTLVIHKDKTISIILEQKYKLLTQEIFQVDISFSRNRICEKYLDEYYWRDEIIGASFKK